VAAGRRRKVDAELVMALACGASPESAAQKAGLSLRTVYRRLAEPAFGARVRQVRGELLRRAAGMFTVAGMGAIKTLMALQESAASESVRLQAARALIELGCKLRESEELMERLASLEARLEGVLEAAADREGEFMPER
jgi:hypothetical protein